MACLMRISVCSSSLQHHPSPTLPTAWSGSRTLFLRSTVNCVLLNSSQKWTLQVRTTELTKRLRHGEAPKPKHSVKPLWLHQGCLHVSRETPLLLHQCAGCVRLRTKCLINSKVRLSSLLLCHVMLSNSIDYLCLLSSIMPFLFVLPQNVPCCITWCVIRLVTRRT